MRVSLVLPEANVFPDLEQHVFDFTGRLGRYCASIASCSIAIEAAPDLPQPAFAVKLALQVFGETLQLAALTPTQPPTQALTAALDDVFRQASSRLESISQDHYGCGCGLEAGACTPCGGGA